jgi:RNA polymerase sigma-70 factor (ECF subfamily)
VPPTTTPPPPFGTAEDAASSDSAFAVDWEKAIRAHGRRVIVSLLALGVCFEDAEEIAQRAWTRLIEQQQAGALPVVKLPGLAIAQARYLALSELRTRARNAGATPLERIVEERARADEQLIDAERVRRALEILAGCSPTARRVFAALLDDPPPSHADVAAALGISVQRVRQTLCEVRKTLRRSEETRT